MTDLNNNTKNGEHNTQRNTSYRAMIPFYILYDLDLNANHLRMYGQIEQMESNPDPRVSPSFSYQWLADQLGIDRSNAIRTANVLKSKNLIEHVQNAQGNWFWRTVKAQVVCLDTDSTSIASGAQCDPPVAPSATPPVAPSATQRSQKLISQNLTNNSLSISLSLSDETESNKEPIKKNTKKKVEYSYSVDDALENNPHDIDRELIEEWVELRKSKHKSDFTKRVWERHNRIAGQLVSKGVPMFEIMDRLLAKGWQGIEESYFSDLLKTTSNQTSSLIKSNKPSYDDNDISWINQEVL